MRRKSDSVVTIFAPRLMTGIFPVVRGTRVGSFRGEPTRIDKRSCRIEHEIRTRAAHLHINANEVLRSGCGCGGFAHERSLDWYGSCSAAGCWNVTIASSATNA